MSNAPQNAALSNLDAEESILGACLLTPRAIEAVAEILHPGDWYRQSHERIYEAILALHGEGAAVDSIAVADRLEVSGFLKELGGKERIHVLAALVPAAGNAAHYARIVREMAALRGIATTGEQMVRLAYDRPAATPELIDKAEQMVFALAKTGTRTDLMPIGDGLDETWRVLETLAARGEAVVGVPSGFRDFDRLTAGFQPGNLIIVAGRPGMGKSSYGLSVAANVTIRTGLPVALFTLEMNRGEIQQRLMAMEGAVDLLKLRNGSLGREDWVRLGRVSQVLHDAPLYVEDTAAQTMLDIRGKARRLAARVPTLSLIIVDYVQLLASTGKQENRNQEISQISRSLKLLAGELQVPIMALSQLSRDVEKRHDKRPMLSDLRDSGSLEQDADLVAFLYRDSYYNAEDAELDGTAGVCEVNLAKQRNGPTDTVKLAFVDRFARFSNLDHLHSV